MTTPQDFRQVEQDVWELPKSHRKKMLVPARLLGDRQRAVADGRMAYIKNAADAVRAVDEGSFDAAFLLNSTSLEALRAVAGAGERMPAKSTYFYPKLLSGLIMRLIH